MYNTTPYNTYMQIGRRADSMIHQTASGALHWPNWPGPERPAIGNDAGELEHCVFLHYYR